MAITVEDVEVGKALQENTAALRVSNLIALAQNMGKDVTDASARGQVLRQLTLVEEAVRADGAG
jgi:hypothetical protein